MSSLFAPLSLRSLSFRNRIGISPMCMYSSTDGFPSDWHLVHLPARAVGGAGLVIQEATAVSPVGRISPNDAGMWSDDHVEPWARVVKLVREHGAVAGIQLAHAGTKAGTARPWDGGQKLPVDRGGWQAVGVTDRPFKPTDPPVHALDDAEIQQVIRQFADAAKRSLAAGYQVAEVHGAHGYLAHSFYSPLMNTRTDRWGGTFENRVRFILEVTRAVRKVWPDSLPVFVRLSCSDWADGGWTIEDSIDLARRLKAEGVDAIDCSSGGASLSARMTIEPGYQVPFASAIRRGASMATAAVGLITSAQQAERIVADGQADVVLLGRESLRDPHWPLRTARELAVVPPAPPQYLRAIQ